MAQSVKLADEIMADTRKEAERQSRSVAGQITHWIKIGRAIERSKSFDYHRINAALDADLSPDRLTSEEQEVWFEEFAAKMTEPGPQETEFHAKRRKIGRGVGMSNSGDLVYGDMQDS